MTEKEEKQGMEKEAQQGEPSSAEKETKQPSPWADCKCRGRHILNNIYPVYPKK